MEKLIFEKREATGREKAISTCLDPNTSRLYFPQMVGKKEAEKILPKVVYPCVFVSRSSYIPVRYRNEKYIVK